MAKEITKEVWILPELWREHIKPCLFHNIKTQGKHFKKDTYIKKYNDVIKSIPQKYNIKQGKGLRVVYNSATKSFRVVKMFYMVPHPRAIKTKSPAPYNLIVEYTPCGCWQDGDSFLSATARAIAPRPRLPAALAQRAFEAARRRLFEEYKRGGINTLWY